MDSGKSLGRARTFNLNRTCSSVPPPVLTPRASPTLSTGHGEGDFLVFGDFVQINVEQLVGQDVVLDFLDDGQAVGLGVALDGEVEQDVFGGGAVDDIADVLEIDFQVLGLVELPVNDGGNATGGAQGFGTGPPAQSPRKRV